MDIHEYQAKQLFMEWNIPVPSGRVATNGAEAERIATELFTQQQAAAVVVKAQIHAGGRGKGHIATDPSVRGVAVVKSATAAGEHAGKLLGKTLITHQTGPEGQVVRRVWVECASAIQHEFYASVLVDRATSRVTFLVSRQGGMDIEEVAAKQPEALHRVSIDPLTGFCDFHGLHLAKALELKGDIAKKAVHVFRNLYQAFVAIDASLIEVNPLVLTQDDQWIALDAKVNLDDNALYRQSKIAAFRDKDEENAKEIAARDAGLSYVAMDGNIGCLVNGAGLAMATMDIIKNFNGTPANFLDVGGGATAAQVTEAFKIILSDKQVKAILVNIFGGIAKCDVIAEGIITAAKDVQLHVPLVVRLEGTRVNEGKELLNRSGLTIIAANDMSDAARKVVSAAQGVF